MAEKDKTREHKFDGIEEYDNDLPRWWIWLFVLTVIFAAVYPFIYDFGPAEFASETVDAQMAEFRASQQAATASVASDEGSLLKLAGNPATIKEGQEIYAGRCAPCHAPLGQGLVGPNLTDDFWIHGGTITDIHRTVVNGVLEKGMIAWKDQLTPDQINAVVAFIWTLHGTNPPNGKAAEGPKVERPS